MPPRPPKRHQGGTHERTECPHDRNQRRQTEGDRGRQGPLLLLLHGFPQCAYLWRNQIDDLVAAGYQVAVPDQRGYGGSDKPADPQAYDTLTLSADAVGIADALGHETFTLVTHDWGAIVAGTWHRCIHDGSMRCSR